MTIEAFSRRDVVVVDASGTIADAARTMRAHQVGCVVVMRGEGHAMRMVGVVSDRDIAMAVAADGREGGTSIGLLARHPVVTIPRTAGLAEACAAMRAAAVRRLVVVDEHGRMIGIVSLDDVLGGVANLLQDLSLAVASPHDPAAPACGGSYLALAVAPELAAHWRRVIQP